MPGRLGLSGRPSSQWEGPGGLLQRRIHRGGIRDIRRRGLGVRERSDLLWSAAQQLTLIVPGVLMMWLLGRAWERRRLATRVKS